jgi:hypothetical protein
MSRLQARVEALVELGLIKDQDSLAAFGRELYVLQYMPDERTDHHVLN